MKIKPNTTYRHKSGKLYRTREENGGLNYAYSHDTEEALAGVRNKDRALVIGRRNGKDFGPVRYINLADLIEEVSEEAK